jgi:TRAP transporter 4TM/12TM fusion protein
MSVATPAAAPPPRTGVPPGLTRLIAVSLGLYHLYTSLLGLPPVLVHRAIHFGGMALLAYLVLASRRMATERRRSVDVGLGIVAASAGLYIVVFFPAPAARIGSPEVADVVVATLTAVVILDLGRRLLGWPLVGTAGVFLLYGLAGPLVPGFLAHRGYTPVEILEFLYVTTEGFFGVPIQVSSTYLVVFIMFAAFLERSGITGFFNDVALAIAGRTRNGVAKVAVLSSALMGTVNGSGLANVATTGAVTIPMMKRDGFAPHYAAAVEATASMGGQIMPPVMGVAAFLMAERIGVPYPRIALAAIVPALLYFTATFVQIHLHASGGRSGTSKVVPARPLAAILRRDGYLVLPLFALIGLMLAGYSPIYAAVTSMAATVAMSWAAAAVTALRHPGSDSPAAARPGLSPAVAPSPGRGARFAGECAARGATPAGILASIESGVRNTVGVAMACALVGIIIGIVTLTGGGLKLSSAIVMAAGASLAPALVLTMIACFILGMGLPTIPTYIITSAMAAPALIRLGVDRLAADFFVMYFGVLANITPPVALAAYAAAGIAGASPLKTSLTAIRLSIAGFLVPYIFVYSPVLLGIEFSAIDLLHVGLTSLAGVLALGAAMEGHLLRPAMWYERALLAAAAIDLIVPGPVTDTIGAVLIGLVILSQRRRGRPRVPV